MGLFDENQIEGNPITAQLLKSILDSRMVNPEDSMEVRCDRLLQHMYNKVRFNTEEQITHHDTSLAALGINGSPFTDEYTDRLNELVNKGKSSSEIEEWMGEHPMQINDKMREFVNFMRKRGFKVSLYVYRYLTADSEERNSERFVKISWD